MNTCNKNSFRNKTPLRIALLGPANSIHLQRWAFALVAQGLSVCIVSQHRCDKALLPPAADIFWLPHTGKVGYFTNALKLRSILAHWHPDLLNVHYASGYGSTAVFSGFQPILLSVWGSDIYDFPHQSGLKGWLLRRNLRHATAIASTSHVMAHEVRHLTPERKNISITPFGVDMTLFCPQKDIAHHNELTIGIIKTLAPQYGIDLLLLAFSKLIADPEIRTSHPNCQLLIVGDGPQYEELTLLAHDLGISDRTQFIGQISHTAVPKWLNKLDIYVAPSRFESFGVAIVEASACGLPVVVSDAGGLPEVVIHNETGLVIPRNDVTALLLAIKQLAMSPHLREQLGTQGRHYVEREYEWNSCIDKMVTSYENTIHTYGN